MLFFPLLDQHSHKDVYYVREESDAWQSSCFSREPLLSGRVSGAASQVWNENNSKQMIYEIFFCLMLNYYYYYYYCCCILADKSLWLLGFYFVFPILQFGLFLLQNKTEGKIIQSKLITAIFSMAVSTSQSPFLISTPSCEALATKTCFREIPVFQFFTALGITLVCNMLWFCFSLCYARFFLVSIRRSVSR